MAVIAEDDTLFYSPTFAADLEELCAKKGTWDFVQLQNDDPSWSKSSADAMGASARGPSHARSIPGSRAAPGPARSPSRRKDSRTGRAAAVSSRTGAPVGLVSVLVNFPYLHDRCLSWQRLRC